MSSMSGTPKWLRDLLTDAARIDLRPLAAADDRADGVVINLRDLPRPRYTAHELAVPRQATEIVDTWD